MPVECSVSVTNSLFTAFSISTSTYVDYISVYVLPLRRRRRPKLVLTGTSIPLYLLQILELVS